MSESESDFTERTAQTNPGASGVPLGVQYSPTEEERRVLKECDRESFWYRSVPISLGGMVLTQFLVSRGTLSASQRFGSLPKVLFAGVCGYFAGKLSYMRTCQEKFYRLENSPIGEALRQRRPAGVQSEGQTESPNFSKDVQGDDAELQGRPTASEEPRGGNAGSYDRTNQDPPAKYVKKNKYGDAWED